MRYTIHVFYKYPKELYRGYYRSRFKIIAWIKALWDTKGNWQYFDYQFE